MVVARWRPELDRSRIAHSIPVMNGGFRLGAGYWFGPELGIEAGFSMLESQSTLFSARNCSTSVSWLSVTMFNCSMYGAVANS